MGTETGVPAVVDFLLTDGRSLDSRETVRDRSHFPTRNCGRCSMFWRLAHLVGRALFQPELPAPCVGSHACGLAHYTHQKRHMLAIRKSRLPQVQLSTHMCFLRMFSRKGEGGRSRGPVVVPLTLSVIQFWTRPLTVRPLMITHTVPVAASQAEAEVGVLNGGLTPTALSVPHISLTT